MSSLSCPCSDVLSSSLSCRYPVPFKKLSEARSQYTNLEAFTKGTIHQINKETDTRDPREFVADEGLVLYRC